MNLKSQCGVIEKDHPVAFHFHSKLVVVASVAFSSAKPRDLRKKYSLLEEEEDSDDRKIWMWEALSGCMSLF